MTSAGGYHLHVGGNHLHHTAAVLHLGIGRPAGTEVATIWIHHGACIDPAARRHSLVRLLLILNRLPEGDRQKPCSVFLICVSLHHCQPDVVAVHPFVKAQSAAQLPKAD